MENKNNTNMNKSILISYGVACVIIVLLTIISGFIIVSNQIEKENNLNQTNKELQDKIVYLTKELDNYKKINEELRKDNQILAMGYLKLEKEVQDWRQTTLDIINKMNEWYSSNPIVIEKIVHHSSSSSSNEDDSDDEEIEICELTSDECGENEYLDASNCRCISRRPPVEEPKDEVD